MLSTTIWERYFLREIIKTALFFLLCFFGLYVVIDYASHSATFQRNAGWLLWQGVALYYLCEFVQRLEVLLPLALLIATVRTLCALNTHHELIALMSSGIGLKRLLQPFLLVGIACTGLLYLNYEYLSPIALKELKHMSTQSARYKIEARQTLSAQHLILKDGSTLIYQQYDDESQRFFDVYWIRSVDDIYRMQYLTPGEHAAIGQNIDHLARNSDGNLITTDFLVQGELPALQFHKRTLFQTTSTPEEQSISRLWNQLPEMNKRPQTDQEALLTSSFYHKLLMPWLCLLAVIGPAPYCLRITRTLPIFFIYAGSLVSFVIFYLVMGTATLLGKRQILPPEIAMMPPFFVALVGCIGRFVRIR